MDGKTWDELVAENAEAVEALVAYWAAQTRAGMNPTVERPE